jgi:hypothetical protein
MVYMLERVKLPIKKIFNSILYNKKDLITLILILSVSIMVRRSIPIPQPPVGGRPYSSAVQKFSSIN